MLRLVSSQQFVQLVPAEEQGNYNRIGEALTRRCLDLAGLPYVRLVDSTPVANRRTAAIREQNVYGKSL